MMTHRRIRDAYAPISPTDLALVESVLNRRLPIDLRSQALQTNGGAFGNSAIVRTPSDDFGINVMLAIKSLFKSDSFVSAVAALPIDLTSEYCPIANDPNGNYFAVPWDASHPVVLWDHAVWECTVVTESIASLLASVAVDDRSLPAGDIPRALAIGDVARLQEVSTPTELRQYRSEEGETALMLAAAFGEPFVLRWLLSLGHDPNERDSRGRSALHHMANGHSNDCCLALLQAGALIDAFDHDRATPLLRCIECASPHSAWTLVRSGADRTVRNRFGQSAKSAAWDDDCRAALGIQ